MGEDIARLTLWDEQTGREDVIDADETSYASEN